MRLKRIIAMLFLLAVCLTSCKKTPASESSMTGESTISSDNLGLDETSDAVTESGTLDNAVSGVNSANANNNNNTGGSGSTSTGKNTVKNTGYPIVDKKITLKITTLSFSHEVAHEKMTLFQEYEKETNIHIDWEELPSSDLTTVGEKLTLAFQSGNTSDMYMMGSIFGDTNMITYSGANMIRAISDYYDYAPNLKKLLDAHPDTKKSLTVNGKIYGVPQLRLSDSEEHDRYQVKMYINKKWLDELGLAVPTTIDEMEDVLRAFRDNDPNGNQKKDEIPLIMENASAAWQTFFLSPFGGPIYVNAYNNFTLDDSNKVIYGMSTTAYKKGLQWMSELQKEGLFDDDWLGQSASGFKNKLAKNRAGVCISYALQLNLEDEKLLNNWVMIDPITEKKGQQKTWIYTTSGMVTPDSAIITSSCKYPEAAARWLDFFFTNDGAMSAIYGPEGIRWIKNSDGTYNDLGNKNRPSNITDDLTWQGTLTPHVAMTFGTDTDLGSITKPIDGKPSAEMIENQAFKAETQKHYSNCKPKYIMPKLLFTQQQADKIDELYPAISEYANSFFVQMVQGQKSVTADWDTYMAELKKLGLDELTAIYQKSYNGK